MTDDTLPVKAARQRARAAMANWMIDARQREIRDMLLRMAEDLEAERAAHAETQRRLAWQTQRMSLMFDSLRGHGFVSGPLMMTHLEGIINGKHYDPNPIRVHRDRDLGDEREDGE